MVAFLEYHLGSLHWLGAEFTSCFTSTVGIEFTAVESHIMGIDFTMKAEATAALHDATVAAEATAALQHQPTSCAAAAAAPQQQQQQQGERWHGRGPLST